MTPDSNTAIGYESLRNNETGSHNTALGVNSGRANVAGSGNTYIGMNAGSSLLSGNNNLIVGASSANGVSSLDNSTIINTSNQPDGNSLTGAQNVLAISSFSGQPTQIWHQSDITVSRETTDEIIILDSQTYNAAFIEYSLHDVEANLSRVGYIKINLLPESSKPHGLLWEYSEDVATCIGDSYQCTFTVGKPDERYLILSLVNDYSENVYVHLSCRLNKINIPK
jgi:hypothetical protein